MAMACICSDILHLPCSETEAKCTYDNEEKSENELRTSRYRLSHFVAPLYVAPSPTPSNANPRSSGKVDPAQNHQLGGRRRRRSTRSPTLRLSGRVAAYSFSKLIQLHQSLNQRTKIPTYLFGRPEGECTTLHQ